MGKGTQAMYHDHTNIQTNTKCAALNLQLPVFFSGSTCIPFYQNRCTSSYILIIFQSFVALLHHGLHAALLSTACNLILIIPSASICWLKLSKKAMGRQVVRSLSPTGWWMIRNGTHGMLACWFKWFPWNLGMFSTLFWSLRQMWI